MSVKKNKKTGKKGKPSSPVKETKSPKAQVVKGSVRPLVLGDEHMAFRLHVFFLSDSVFEVFNPSSILETSYDPNLIIIIGPLNTKANKAIEEELKRNENYKLIFACSTNSDEEVAIAEKQAQQLKADGVVIKDFVTVEDIKELIVKVTND